MKTIVDTCAWSLALRRPNQANLPPDELRMIAQLQEAIRDGRAIMLGPIRQEILSGVRDKARFTKLKNLLDPFPDETIAAEDFVEAARLSISAAAAASNADPSTSTSAPSPSDCTTTS